MSLAIVLATLVMVLFWVLEKLVNKNPRISDDVADQELRVENEQAMSEEGGKKNKNSGSEKSS